MGSREVEEMYLQLVRWYSRRFITPRREVEREIKKRMARGLTREEALRQLYEEEKRLMEGFTAPQPTVECAEPPISKLESSLEALRSSSGYKVLAAIIMFFISALSATSIITASIQGFVAALLFMAILGITLLALISSDNMSWKFEEEIVVKGAGGALPDVLQEVPKIYQALTLEEALSQVEGDRLQLKVKLTRAIAERDRYGSRYIKSADLGFFTIDAHFERREDNLVAKVSYTGNPPREYASLAADEYEKLVVAFRAAVNEAWERVKPRAAVTLDFAKLAELIASRGLIIAAARCPYCGGSVDLPKGGDTVKCSYCGTTLKANEVYEVIKKLVKELA